MHKTNMNIMFDKLSNFILKSAAQAQDQISKVTDVWPKSVKQAWLS